MTKEGQAGSNGPTNSTERKSCTSRWPAHLDCGTSPSVLTHGRPMPSALEPNCMSMCTPWNTCLQQGAVATGCCGDCSDCRRASTAGGIASRLTGKFALKEDATLCGTAHVHNPLRPPHLSLEPFRHRMPLERKMSVPFSCTVVRSTRAKRKLWVVGHSTCLSQHVYCVCKAAQPENFFAC